MLSNLHAKSSSSNLFSETFSWLITFFHFDRPIYKLGKYIHIPWMDIPPKKPHWAVKTEGGRSLSVQIYCWYILRCSATLFILTARYTNLEYIYIYHKWTSSNKNLTGRSKLKAGSPYQSISSADRCSDALATLFVLTARYTNLEYE